MDTPGLKRHDWRSDHLRLAVTAADVALWAWNVGTGQFTIDDRGFEFWGLPWRNAVTFEELSAHICRADRDRVRAAVAATRAVLGSSSLRVTTLTPFAVASGRGRADGRRRERGDEAGARLP